jgi:hypothetical protein
MRRMRKLFTVLVLGSLGTITARAAITFDPKESRLTSEGTPPLSPAEIYDQPRERHTAGALTLEFSPQSVRAVNPAKPNVPVWSVQFKQGEGFQWLANDAQTIYLKKHVAGEQGMQPEPGSTLYRMSIKDGSWLTNVKLDPKPPADAHTEIASVEALPSGGVAVLTARLGKENVDSFHVATLTGDKINWSSDITPAAQPPAPGGRVLGPFGPQPFPAEVNTLSVVGKRVIVCAGPMGPIVAFDAATGKESWRLEDLWQYQRGFTGPVLMQYFLTPGGEMEGGPPKPTPAPVFVPAGTAKPAAMDPAKLKALRETCNLVGGPIAVPHRKGHHLFVAVARHDPRAVGYVAQCSVYEISDEGVPLAVAPMPRMILGSHYKLLNDSLLWGFEGNAFAKFVPTDQIEFVDNRVRGTDHLVRMEWYRQPPDVRRDARAGGAWLTSGPAGDPVGLDGTLLARLPGGGYVLKQGDKTFHFPIALTDLSSGKSRSLTLDVPVSEPVPAPEANFSQYNGQYTTAGPYKVAIVGLELTGKDLYLRLATEQESHILRFDISRLTPDSK